MNQESREAVVLTHVTTNGVRQFDVETFEGYMAVYIPGGTRYLDLVERVNKLRGDKVRIVVTPVEWELEERSGIKHFLKSIEKV